MAMDYRAAQNAKNIHIPIAIRAVLLYNGSGYMQKERD